MSALAGIDEPAAPAPAPPGDPIPALDGLQRGLAPPATPAAWRLAAFAGRLAEIRGTAALTLAFGLVHEAQRRGEPVAWVVRRERAFYPPDVAGAGVDLDALAVIRAAGAPAVARAAGHLLRSGAFGLVVLDLAGPEARLPLGAQVALAGLAQKHATALVCLTEDAGGRSPLGSLVSLRADTLRERAGGEGFRCLARVVKDKRRGPGWTHAEHCHGPDGVR